MLINRINLICCYRGGYSGYLQDLDDYYWEVAYGDMWQFDDQNMIMIDA